MTSIPVLLDAATERVLQQLVDRDHADVSAVASKLLAQAALSARPRRTFNSAAIKVANAEHEHEDLDLAESGSDERKLLLDAEDAE